MSERLALPRSMGSRQQGHGSDIIDVVRIVQLQTRHFLNCVSACIGKGTLKTHNFSVDVVYPSWTLVFGGIVQIHWVASSCFTLDSSASVLLDSSSCFGLDSSASVLLLACLSCLFEMFVFSKMVGLSVLSVLSEL
jgi:hypothetical protein